jgi:ribosome-associated translation inhibitor RaiA
MDKRVPPEWPRNIAFELHSPEIPLPPDVAAYVRAKLLAKLAKFGHQITDIVVHLKDCAAGHGGVEKCCHIEARLAGLEPVNVEERDEDLRAAIDLAVERTAEAVHRHVERTRSKRLQQGRRLVRRTKIASP